MKFDWLKGKCKSGKVSVYSARTNNAHTDERTISGRRMIMTVRTFDVHLLGRDQQAWPAIESNANRIEAVLECRRCKHHHVIVRNHVDGREALTSPHIGQTGVGNVSRIQVEGFSNDVRFDVRHSGGWFEFSAPMMFEERGTIRFTCQKCGEREEPKVRLS